jgi:tetratricopeptide (TPR) repeat protein
MIISALDKLAEKMDWIFQLKRYEQVLGMANQVLINCPDSLDTHLIRGGSLWKLQRYPDAIAEFSFVLHQEPHNIKAKVGRYICYIKLNSLDQNLAEMLLDEEITINPQDYDLLNCRSIINCRNGKLLDALEDCSIAIKMGAEPLETYYLNRGELYLRLQRYNEAIEDFNKALQSSPCEYNQPYLFFNRAKAYLENGEPEIAALDIRRAIRLKPEEMDFQKLAAKIIPGWQPAAE